MTYGLSLITWSCFTLVQGFVPGPMSMMAARLGLGVCEAPCFPANSRVLAHWFPQGERARANSIYSIGMYGGIAFLSVPLFWLAQAYGWRALFILTGLVGVVFGLLWFMVYREPQDSQLANQAERDYIVAGGGLQHSTSAKAPFNWRQAFRLLGNREILCAAIAQFGGNAVLTFFLIDFINYLSVERHMAWLKVGIAAAFPYIAAAIGGLVAGQVSDLLLKKIGNATLARKLVMVTGLVLASLLPLSILVPQGQDGLVIVIMSIVFFGQGATNQGWTVISDIAPKQLIGVTGGVFNLITNLSGILIPIVIGVILQYTGSYNWALLFTGALPLIGAFLYVFVMGDIKRLEIAD
jgi:ACS family D-galactonate transporter-like MFS transporter